MVESMVARQRCHRLSLPKVILRRGVGLPFQYGTSCTVHTYGECFERASSGSLQLQLMFSPMCCWSTTYE